MVSRALVARNHARLGRVRALLDSGRGRAAISAVLVFVPALAVYRLTMLSDVGFWDTAEFQAIGPVLGIAHPTGYPAYTLLAWLASVIFQPFGNEAVRANLLSAVLAAGGCAVVAATVTLVTRRLIVGVGAGAALAASPEPWSIGLHADPHAFHLFLAALILLLLVSWAGRVGDGRPADRWLIGAAAVYGLSLANHGLTFLLAPGIALFVLLVEPGILRRPRFVASCVAALAATTIVLYAYLPLRGAMNPPLEYANAETLDGFLYLVLAEQFRGDFRALPDLLTVISQIVRDTFEQLGLVAALALAGLAVATLRRPGLVVLLGTWVLVNWFFALGYVNADIGRYYLVPLMSVAVLGGLGAGYMLDVAQGVFERPAGTGAVAGRGGRALPAALAAIAGVILITPVLGAVVVRRDALDESGQIYARRWLMSAATALPPDAVVISWWSYSTTLWYGQAVERLRPDVTVIDDSAIVKHELGDPTRVIDSYLGRRPVFLIRLPSDMGEYSARYVLVPLDGIEYGPIFRVEARRAGGDGPHL